MNPALIVALLCLISVTASASPRNAHRPEGAQETDAPVAARGEECVIPNALGWNVSLRGEVDMLGSGLNQLSAATPVVALGYTRKHVGVLLGVLVQASPGLRAEARFHPSGQGGLRPYLGVGATTFFREQTREGTPTFFGGVSGRGVLGVETRLTSRLYGFADLAYERLLKREELYRANAVLFSVGVGLFP